MWLYRVCVNCFVMFLLLLSMTVSHLNPIISHFFFHSETSLVCIQWLRARYRLNFTGFNVNFGLCLCSSVPFTLAFTWICLCVYVWTLCLILCGGLNRITVHFHDYSCCLSEAMNQARFSPSPPWFHSPFSSKSKLPFADRCSGYQCHWFRWLRKLLNRRALLPADT